MKFGIIVFITISLFLSCTKEPKPCTVSSFIGTWKVKNNIICEVDSTNEFVIEQGPWSSQIQMKYGTDTLVYTVIDCKAKHSSSGLGWMRTSELDLTDDEIEFKHNRLVLILWQNCSMTLVRK
jgi:hypothetical protein